MPLTKEPDYTKYSLDELYEAVRHNDGFQYPERDYQLAIEIEKRIGKPVKKRMIERLRVRPWREWIFEHGESPRNATNIMEWWERRRVFYICYFFILFGSCLLTFAGFVAIVTLRKEGISAFYLQLSDIPLLLREQLLVVFPSLFFSSLLIGSVVSMLYGGFKIIDELLNVPLKFLGWRLSVALFQIVLVVTFLVLSIPTVLLLVQMVSS